MIKKVIFVLLIISIIVGICTDFVYGKYTCEYTFDIAKITIQDSIPPILDCQKENKNGKVEVTIISNEPVQEIEGWILSEDRCSLSKTFDSNIKYDLDVKDIAGNVSTIEINITEATYIKLKYASHNSEVGWSYNQTNYSIAGQKALDVSGVLKTESLVFNISGNVEKDFVQAQAYIYSHWNLPEVGACKFSKNIYAKGYSQWKSMNSNDLVTIDGTKYFQFGGTGINAMGNKNTIGTNPIPENIARQYRYGICGINFKLKSYEMYSIVYQIYVTEAGGWLTPKSDGEETMYSTTAPISAFRVALIPKSEKQGVIEEWSKVVNSVK